LDEVGYPEQPVIAIEPVIRREVGLEHVAIVRDGNGTRKVGRVRRTLDQQQRSIAVGGGFWVARTVSSETQRVDGEVMVPVAVEVCQTGNVGRIRGGRREVDDRPGGVKPVRQVDNVAVPSATTHQVNATQDGTVGRSSDGEIFVAAREHIADYGDGSTKPTARRPDELRARHVWVCPTRRAEVDVNAIAVLLTYHEIGGAVAVEVGRRVDGES